MEACYKLIFLCFSVKDRLPLINDFYRFLSIFGLDIWYDRRNIYLGHNRIEKNIRYCIFVFSLYNVAIIISRKGFSSNAKKAALGILKEQGKLIVNITDADLIAMINLKKEGKEPSDYMLERVERMLIGISL